MKTFEKGKTCRCLSKHVNGDKKILRILFAIDRLENEISDCEQNIDRLENEISDCEQNIDRLENEIGELVCG
jgi:peptidoglycan hydrolase CwlO-like protein